MRKFPFLILLIIFQNSIAQNYRNIPVHGNLYFIDSLNYIFPIDPDSIKFENGDSVIYHFKSLRPSNWKPGDTSYTWLHFYNLLGDSWAGNKTILKSDTSTIWFAMGGDSIIIKNKAKMSDIWLVNAKRKFYGKVTSHNLVTFLGISDSVKYLKIGSLNTVTSEITGQEFWLSKNFGFIKMPDIYSFYMTSIIGSDFLYFGSILDHYRHPFTGPMGNTTIIGSNLILGTKTKLTERMVNDFEVGDEFNMSSNSSSGFGCDFLGHLPKNFILSSSNTENRVIKSKNVKNQSDSIFYEMEFCGIKINNYYSSDKDYIAYSGNKVLKLPYRNIGHIPLKIYFPDPITISTLTIKNGLYFEDIFDFVTHSFCSNDYLGDTAISLNCYEKTPEGSITCGNQMLEGTGKGYFSSNSECTSDSYCLNYFKKGSLIGGMPNDFNCDTLIARTILGINVANLQKSITIQPNPFSETLTIKSDGRIQNINIYNLQMQLMQMIQNINNQEVTLNLNNLPSGVYIAEVILTDQRKTQYKIMKSD